MAIPDYLILSGALIVLIIFLFKQNDKKERKEESVKAASVESKKEESVKEETKEINNNTKDSDEGKRIYLNSYGSWDSFTLCKVLMLGRNEGGMSIRFCDAIFLLLEDFKGSDLGLDSCCLSDL